MLAANYGIIQRARTVQETILDKKRSVILRGLFRAYLCLISIVDVIRIETDNDVPPRRAFRYAGMDVR
jgi:hypothetical protein